MCTGVMRITPGSRAYAEVAGLTLETSVRLNLVTFGQKTGKKRCESEDVHTMMAMVCCVECRELLPEKGASPSIAFPELHTHSRVQSHCPSLPRLVCSPFLSEHLASGRCPRICQNSNGDNARPMKRSRYFAKGLGVRKLPVFSRPQIR